ncbi:MAG: hypothetical protein JXA97_00295 [Anaerolineales bacterium]|nr:hypothetical protein [Anaerolineales bacterium]
MPALGSEAFSLGEGQSIEKRRLRMASENKHRWFLAAELETVVDANVIGRF